MSVQFYLPLLSSTARPASEMTSMPPSSSSSSNPSFSSSNTSTTAEEAKSTARLVMHGSRLDPIHIVEEAASAKMKQIVETHGKKEAIAGVLTLGQLTTYRRKGGVGLVTEEGEEEGVGDAMAVAQIEREVRRSGEEEPYLFLHNKAPPSSQLVFSRASAQDN